MKLKELIIKEGWKGTRGVPDGSGPSPGMAGKGFRRGGCPKIEDYKTRKEYLKALKKWREKNA